MNEIVHRQVVRLKITVKRPLSLCMLACLGAASPLFETDSLAQGVFLRGRCDSVQGIDIGDPLYLLFFLFGGATEPDCVDACDVNDDERLDLSDVLYTLQFLFLDGPPPKPPWLTEDPDPAGDALTCFNGRDPPLELFASPAQLLFFSIDETAVLRILGRGGPKFPEETDERLADDELQDLRTAQPTRYTSSDSEVAIVNEEGVVTATGVGTATVEVSHRGLRREVLVQVVPGADGAPEVRLTSPGDGVVVTAPRITVSGWVSDRSAALAVSGETTPYSPLNGFFSVEVDLDLGDNVLEAVATSATGEGRARVTVRRFEVGAEDAIGPDGAPLPVIPPLSLPPPDRTPPSVAWTTPAPGAVLLSGRIDARGTVDDATAQVRVNGVSATVQNGEFHASLVLGTGPNVLLAEATDPTGNRSSVTLDVTVDATLPRLTIDSPMDSGRTLVSGTEIRLEGSIEPPGTLVFVDGEPAQVIDSSWTADLSRSPGSQPVVVTAALAGSPPRRTQLVRSLIVDDEAPHIVLAHPPTAELLSDDGYLTHLATVIFAGRLADGQVPQGLEDAPELTVGGVVAEVTGGTFRVEVPISPGPNDIELRAADSRGNVLVRTYRVERSAGAAPVLSVDQGNLQASPVGEVFSGPLVVRAVDALSNGQADVPLRFEVVQGGATFADGRRRREVPSEVDGRARVDVVAGDQSGKGAVVVTVEADAHGSSPVAFVLDVLAGPSRVLVPRSDRHVRAPAGGTVALETSLLDDRGNPVAQEEITYRVVEGEATVGGVAELVVLTGFSGSASTLVELPGSGASSSVILAIHGSGAEARFHVDGVLPGALADTRLSGILRDERGLPLAGASVRVLGLPEQAGVATVSDDGGHFALTAVPAGEVLLEADGPQPSDAGLRYATIRRRVVAIVGRETFLRRPLVLPRLDADSRSATRFVTPATGAILTVPAYAGVRLQVDPGAALFPDGSRTGGLRLLASHRNALPARPPDDTFALAPLRIEPSGVRFDPPARLLLPHVTLRPGTEDDGRVVPLWQYRAGAGGFVELSGEPVEQGGVFVAFDGARGVREGGSYFVSARGPLNGQSGTLRGNVEVVLPGLREVPQREESALLGTPELGLQVFAHSGELFVEAIDLVLPGRELEYRFRRRYESRHNFRGSLGFNWEHEYEDRRLFPGEVGGNIVRASGTGRFDEYLYHADSGRFVSPIGVFSRLFVDADGFFVERTPQGMRYRYHPFDGSQHAGRLASIRDRHGDELRCIRRGDGLLDHVRDPLGRIVDYDHDSDGRITRITDATGRFVEFAYDAAGDLVAVTGPPVVGTPTGNDFPEGKRTEYRYSGGHEHPSLNHNLLQVVDPREVRSTGLPRVTVSYDEDPASTSFDRVLSQVWGGTNATGVEAGGEVTFRYELYGHRQLSDLDDAGELEAFLLGAQGETHFIDEEGRERSITWSGAGLPLVDRVYTRDDGERPRDSSDLHPPPGLLPPFYATRKTWSRDGLLLREMRPRGDRLEYVYDEQAPLRQARAAVLRVEHHPVSGDDEPPAVTTYRRDPLFARVVETVSPGGNAGLDGGSGGAGGFARRYVLDYQEGNDVNALALEAGVDPADLTAALSHAGIVLGQGDVNEDGTMEFRSGDVVRERMERTVFSDSGPGEDLRTLSTLWTYNRFGQVLSRTDADGRIERIEYHPEADPDGDGEATPDGSLDTTTGGFVAKRITEFGEDRTEVGYRYDSVGFLAERTDARGSITFLTHNALGQLVEERLSSPLRYRRQLFYDGDDNVVQERLENFTSLPNGVHVLVSTNQWLETETEYDLLGRRVKVTREVSGGEVGPEKRLVTRFRYHAGGKLARVLHPEPSTDEAFDYDERGLLIRHVRGVDTSAEAVSTTAYNENGDIVLKSDAADSDGDGEPETTEFRYNGLGHLVLVLDAVGGVRVLERDVEGRLLSESVLGSGGGSAAPGTASPAQVLLERVHRRYDEGGDVLETRHEWFGALTADGEPAPARSVRERFWRDAAGRVVRRLDREGHEWRSQYDLAGRLVLAEDPFGGRRELERDPNGNIVRERRVTVTLQPVTAEPPAPDGEGPDDEVADGPGLDESGRFKEVATILRLFDPLDRLVVLVDPSGGVWRMRYDSRGNRIFVSDATGTVINPETDPELGPLLELMSTQQRTQLNDHGNRRHYLYDNLGRLVEAHHELRRAGRGGGQIDFTEPFVTDGIITETFEWNDNGKLAAWTNESGDRTSVERDASGYVVAKNYPGGARETYVRDLDGNITAFTDANGSLIRQKFDGLHRIVERTLRRDSGVEGTSLQRFEYDGLSRVTFYFDDNRPGDFEDDSRVWRRYDSLGNLIEEVQGRFRTEATYDSLGRQLSLQYPEGRRVATPRDDAGRVARLQDDLFEYAAYTYYGSGRLLQKNVWTGIALSFLGEETGGQVVSRYEVTGDVLEHIYRDGTGAPVAGFEYGRDRSGHPDFVIPHPGGGRGDLWRFDSLYRLRQFIPGVLDPRVPPVNPLERTLFFPDGNHSWRLVDEDLAQRELLVNERSQYTEVDGQTLVYDAVGNLREVGGRTLIYDALNRLVRVEQDGNVVGTYRYDAVGAESAETFRGLGRRVAKDVTLAVDRQPAGVVRYVHWGELVIEERTADGALARQYLHERHGAGDDEVRPAFLIAHSDSASPEVISYLSDAVGTTVALVDEDGRFQETIRYGTYGKPRVANAFGTVVGFSKFGNGFLFGGDYHDFELGLYRVGARYYDPQLGRFITDIAPLLPAAPLTLNGYQGPPLRGVPGEVTGATSERRGADYLQPFKVTLPAEEAVR